MGVGTVYRHFPTLDDLVPACSQLSAEIVALPGPDEIEALFAGLAAPAERIARLVEQAYAIYERGSREINVARREPDAHASERRVVRALIDLDTWESFRKVGLATPTAVAVLSTMLSGRHGAKAQ